MKDEILKIINTTIYYSDVTEGAKAAEELQRLMCYREVSILFKLMRPVSTNELNQLTMTCLSYLKFEYSEENILEAIEKVKNEQK